MVTELNIIDCAKKLLKNTTNIYLKNELEELIINGDCMEEDNMYKVIKCICADGYDISNFGLLEIPHVSVYCFGNIDNNKFFDVYLNFFNSENKEVSIGFLNDDSNTENADNIQMAIESYQIID